ncbi:NitT/TauT family transport system permease protein [Desulfotomaculum arcticum]|uniref:NitT/TauT family transport system permease protein n=1 Tax=Desulfotruncus arcticus DSM 17038 TaxID=1121424 RepID=A0A1I2TJN3_9FIRM|nr:ABC transporter permease [Desulfotruncus arcticus]SFG64329.1 NitT/TauT family transport system permease protein [Desulfotomaculum arcticum] [Desulfotruncus arcticus DSM 17038]
MEENNYRKYLSTICSIAALLAGWELLALAVNNPALPGPIPALNTFLQEVPRGLWQHFLISSYRVFISIALSLVLALPIGMLLGREQSLDRFIAPIIYLVYPIPKIVFLPVLATLLSYGDVSKITLITLVVFFQILVPIRDASRNINAALINSVKSLGAVRLDIYKHVVWPAVLPEMLTSLRVASGTAIAILFFSETISSQEGLGYYLLDAWSRFAYNEMFAGIIAMGLLGLVIYFILDYIEHLICPWKFV